MTEVCSICTDTFNASSRSRVECVQCKKEACRACYTRYFLGRFQEPGCMHCNVAFNYENIYDTFPKSFWKKEYKKHREMILYDLERAQCAATLPFVQLAVDYDNARDELRLCGEEIRRQQQQLHQTRLREQGIQRRMNDMHFTTHASSTKNKRASEYHTPCNTPNCRGFVTKDAPNCACCGNQTCLACHQTIQHDAALGAKCDIKCDIMCDITCSDIKHECNTDDVATVQELRRNAKQCPECKISISKVDGCDQMFCVACHTAFSWNTGERVTGQIHNPHYFEVRAQLGANIAIRNLNGGGCEDEIPDINTLRIAVMGSNTSMPYGPETTLRYAIHIRAVVIPEVRFFANDGRLYSFETNLHQRVAWMRRKYSDEGFRVALHRSDKKIRYHAELLALFQMYVNVVGELFQNMVVQKSLKSYQDIVALKKYARGHLLTIKERYGSQCIKYDVYISDVGRLETT